jgi:hypothetical protein
MIILSFLGIVGYYWHPDFDSFFAFTPSGLMGHFFVWNFASGSLYHSMQHVNRYVIGLILAINVIVVLLNGHFIERLWGKKEYLKFIGVTVAISALLTLLLAIFLYLITGDYSFIYRPIGGFTAGSAALLTALKQLQPDEEIVGGLRRKYLPLVYVIVISLLLAIFSSTLNVAYLLFGWLTSWVYLRWFQVRGDDVRGDSSSEMNFASFFPEALQPLVFVLSQIVQRLCCFWMPKQKSTNVRTSTGAIVSVLDAPQDVERRRAIALKALDEKFMSMKSLPKPTTPIPTSLTLLPPPSNNSDATMKPSS